MRRLMAVLFALSALVVVTMVHSTVHAQPPGRPAAEKTLICHVTDDNGAHIIEVANPALPAHLAHGDCKLNSTNRDLIGDPCNPTDANNDDICDVQP